MANWQIRGVDSETRRLIRIYAATHNMTVAEALAEIIKLALNK